MEKDSLSFGRDKGLHLVHMNVRSLNDVRKIDILKHHIANSKAHIVGISETWLRHNLPNKLFDVQGYRLSRVDRSWKGNNGETKRGGGVAVYYAESLPCSDSKYNHLNFSSKDIELQWLSVNLENLRPIVILNVYRPPQGDYKVFCREILNRVHLANLKDNAEIYLMGDMNIDVTDKTSSETKELILTTKILGLSQHISGRTRFGLTKYSCIDLIFSNSEFIASSGSINLHVSDHVPVYVTRKKERRRSGKVKFRGRSYRNYDKESFQANLLEKNWGDFYSRVDPNQAWEIMKTIIEEEIETMCPFRTFSVRKFDDPWITNEVIEMIRDRDELFKTAKRLGRAEDWTRAKVARNETAGHLRNLKAQYLVDQQNVNSENPKRFWRNISAVWKGHNSKGRVISLESEGREINERESAEYLNSFFTNVGPKLAGDFDPSKWEPIREGTGTKLEDCTLNFRDVQKLCREIKIAKSSGYSHLASRILKDSFMALTNQLVFLFRLSLEAASFPDDWKIATIIPLFKGGNSAEVGNYRPVSLLPLPGKLLEKLVHARISSYMEGNGLLTNHQGGFRKNKSTTSTIVSFTDAVLRAANDANFMLATFVDLKKAFDTVNHAVLMRKLQHLGLGGELLNWCKSYLSNRSQSTICNDVRSKSSIVKCGVPQGSVLGPLFFLAYINDMVDSIGDIDVRLFADDTVLFVQGKDLEYCKNKIQSGLDKFSKWCKVNALHVNTYKTKVMAFGTQNRLKKLGKFVLKLDDVQLQQVSSYKYLGVTLDPSLNFKQHLASVTRTVSHKLYILSRLRRYLSDRAALLIYKSMVLPYMDYSDVVYTKAAEADLDRLQRLQNRALKICLNSNRHESTEYIHRQTKVPLLDNRRKNHLLSYMYKQKDLGINLDIPRINTRSADAPRFVLRQPNLSCYKRSVEYEGAKAWNRLPNSLKLTPNYLSFKNKINRKLLDTVR